MEEILGESCGTEGVLQDEEVAFSVGITVGIVFPELMPREPERCSPVEAICQPVAGGLAPGGVAAPAAGGHPLMAVAGSVGVDGYQADISLTHLLAPGVDVLGTGAEGDVVFFRRDQYWRCWTTAAAISQVYLYSRKTPSGKHLPGVLHPWPLSMRIFIVEVF